MVRHAINCFPFECCGVISGNDQYSSSVHPIKNLDYRKHRYSMDMDQLDIIISKIEQSSEEVIGFYHSHTDTDSNPSKIDIEMANWPSVFYVIVSLAERNLPNIKAFKISDKNVTECEIVFR